jgi:hypothetical protein
MGHRAPASHDERTRTPAADRPPPPKEIAMTPRHLASSRTSTRRFTRALAAFGLAIPLALAACGGGDGGDEEASDAATVETDAGDAAGAADAADAAGSAAAGGEQDAGFGGAGHWTAGQLCTLTDLMTMGALFPGVEVIETPGLDEVDSSVCNWDDASVDPLDPASTLFTVSQQLHNGDTFCDCFDTIEIPGSDQAVFADELYTDTMSGVLVAIGDRSLAVEYVKGTTGAREVAELIATVWVSMQAI